LFFSFDLLDSREEKRGVGNFPLPPPGAHGVRLSPSALLGPTRLFALLALDPCGPTPLVFPHALAHFRGQRVGSSVSPGRVNQILAPGQILRDPPRLPRPRFDTLGDVREALDHGPAEVVDADFADSDV